MYGQEAHTASSKGKGGLSKSTTLMKQMSGFRSENLCDSAADEDRIRDGNCSHVCKYCKREFSSGRALGGHMRAHGSLSFDSDAAAWNTNHPGRILEKLEQLSSSGGHGDAQPSLEYDPDADSDHAVSKSSYPGLSCRIELDLRADKPSKIAKDFGHLARSSDDPDASGSGKDGDEDEEDASIKASANSAIYSNGDGAVAHGENAHEAEYDNVKWFSNLHGKPYGGPLYTLRRNPKPSKRLVDQEFAAMEALQQASAPITAAPLKKSSSSNPFSDKACTCTECGKEFSSWKALFGHMRCHPEREWRGIQRPFAQDQEKPMDVSLPVTCKKKQPPSPCEEGGAIKSESDKVLKQSFTSDENSDAESIEAAYINGGGKNSLQSWMTGKRSKRSRQVVRSLQAVTDNAPVNASSEIKEDTDMANCLVMLACASRSQKEPPQMKKMRRTASILSSDFDRRSHSGDIHKNPSTISDQGQHWPHSKDPSSRTKPLKVNADDGSLCEGMNEETATDLHAGKAKYECGTCKRIFKSHQALGGHRASHKKVKGCFARTHAGDGGDFPDSPEGDITDVDLPKYSDEELLPASASKHDPQIYGEDEKETTSYGNKKPGINKRMKGHECSICHRVFPSGQALGGHKRCHWGGAGSETSNVPVSSSSHQQQVPAVSRGLFQRTGREELLDLNLPAPEEEYEEYCMDFRLSSSDPQLNQLTTKSISDENNIITAPKSPGEFISSANDTQLKLTDSTSNGRGEQFLYPGLKHGSAQETESSKYHHTPAQESELEGSSEREFLNNCRYMQCNNCDKVFASVEALGSHHKTHRSVMSSVAAGLTPISA